MDEKTKRTKVSTNEVSFNGYFDKWPNWIRWIFFIPIAIIGYLVTYYLGYFSMYWYYGEKITQGYIWSTYRDIIFVVIPIYIIHECIPKHKFIITTFFASIYIIIAIAGITINLMYQLNTFDLEFFFTFMLPQVLTLGISIYLIIITAKHKIEHN